MRDARGGVGGATVPGQDPRHVHGREVPGCPRGRKSPPPSRPPGSSTTTRPRAWGWTRRTGTSRTRNDTSGPCTYPTPTTTSCPAPGCRRKAASILGAARPRPCSRRLRARDRPFEERGGSAPSLPTRERPLVDPTLTTAARRHPPGCRARKWVQGSVLNLWLDQKSHEVLGTLKKGSQLRLIPLRVGLPGNLSPLNISPPPPGGKLGASRSVPASVLSVSQNHDSKIEIELSRSAFYKSTLF